MIDKKGFAKGVATISLLVLTVAILGVFVVNYMIPVAADHSSDSNVITPGYEACNVLNTYTLTVTQTGGPDPIYNVRIYNRTLQNPFPDQEGFSCGAAPTGWSYKGFFTIGGESYCEYETTKDPSNVYTIAFGESLDFTFSIKITTESVHPFRVSTIDTQVPVGFQYFSFPNITVDCTPPLTSKDFIGPQKEENGVEWIDGETLVNLTGVDQAPHPSGVDKTWYLNILSQSDEPCWVPEECVPGEIPPPPYSDCSSTCIEYCQKYCEDWKTLDSYASWEDCVEDCVHTSEHESCTVKVQPEWHLYKGPFKKEEESCHMLYYFSVDNVGNIEDADLQTEGIQPHVNCFFVDKTAPILEKDNGDAIFDFGEEMFMTDDNPRGDFHWITTKMPITFTCTDQEPHPSDDEKVCFKVSYDYPNWHYITEDYCGHDLTPEGYCCEPVDGNNKYMFYFKEESMHNLEYYCEDAVEKHTDVHVQYYKVDDTPPILLDKWIDGPYYAVEGTCPPSSGADICHLDGESTIDIEVEDGGDICVVDEVWCQWGYTLDGGDFYGWYETFPIQFPEETRHDLVIECYDALGNKMVDKETFYVDKTPPETKKTYVGPQYPVAVAHPTHITSETEVHLDATDDVGLHDSGVAATYYRDVYLDNPDDWHYCYSDCGQWSPEHPGDWEEYTGYFYKEPESCHIIEYYSVDNVGKEEEIKWQCVFVDNTAPTLLEKSVGEPKVEKDGKIYISGQTPIMMRCIDEGDHPVDHVSIWYRYRFAEDCDDLGQTEWKDPAEYCSGNYDGDWCDPNGEEKVIFFTEDSCHELEYYCVDALGHETSHETEIDVVDSKPPEITKTIIGPQIGDCPPGEGQDCYIDGETVIHVEVIDPEPHPVDEVVCKWDYTVTDGDKTGEGETDLTPPFDISFPEESTHILTIKCEDALGNVVEDVETFIVDKTPPEIHKKYGKPHYNEQICMEWYKPCLWCSKECKEWKTIEWISGDTKIKITVEDAGDHKSGIKETKYRYDIVEDDYCWGLLDCQQATTDKDWTVMSDPTYQEFYIEEDSCHLIEIVSTDNVEKSSTHKQCVFVDNRGPDTVKKIGEPKDEWYPGEPGEPESYFYPEETAHCWDETNESIECWEVTTVTPIKMECDDSWNGTDTHPVGEKKICFKVDVDGEDKTLKYCMEYGGWYNLFGDHKGECCRYLEPDEDDHDGCDFFGYKDDCDEVQDLECYEGRKTFYFLEETEHNLQYYCVDRLGNEGPVDEEKFKVEGTKLEIPLYKKWNLISVPFTLLNDDPEVVFDKVFWNGELVDNVSEYIDSVWAYDPEHVMCGHDWCVWSPDGVDNDNLKVMPGWGYWVMVNDKPACEGILDCFWNIFNEKPLWLVIGGSLFSPATTPPSRNLQKGWNLIGYYGTDWQSYPMTDENFMCDDEFKMPEREIFGDKVYCALNSLIDTQEGYPRWSSLWSYVSCGNHNAEWVGLNTCADPENPIQTMLSRMYAGRGYWLELDIPDTYAPATTCLWNNDFECVWTGGFMSP